MGQNAMILIFWMLSFKPGFSLSSFILINRLFSFSSLSAIGMVSYAYLSCWYFSWRFLFQLVSHPAQHFAWFTLHYVPFHWTWVWTSSRNWWTGKPGVLQSVGLQRWTRLSDWTELSVAYKGQTRVSIRVGCKGGERSEKQVESMPWSVFFHGIFGLLSLSHQGPV